MTKLSVNINKIATIRNARGGNMPNLIQVAIDCQQFGADGITVHPRPDERHVRYADVVAMRHKIDTEFNIEGYPSNQFLALVEKVKPEQVTLVPDPPEAITSNSGWDVKANFDFLTEIIEKMHRIGVRVSIFINPDVAQIELAIKTGTDRIELYTEPYASKFEKNREEAIADFVIAASYAKKHGIGVNAGHDLSLQNLGYLSQNIPQLDEVSIGHALICDALYMGLEKTIKAYKAELSRK